MYAASPCRAPSSLIRSCVNSGFVEATSRLRQEGKSSRRSLPGNKDLDRSVQILEQYKDARFGMVDATIMAMGEYGFEPS